GGAGGAGGVDPAGSGGAGGAGGSGVCEETLLGGPAASPYSFMMGNQLAWSHDLGYPAGYFHTYDALDVGGPGDQPHKVHVLVPREYGPCDAGHPVIYMNDGGAVFWPGGAANKSWDVPQGLQSLYAQGAFPRVIVVAIEPVNRDYEYSHVQVSPSGACCGAAQYVAYLADRVKPFIDAHYRTAPGRETTAMVGSSRGGLSSFYVATRRPDVFGMAASMSPSFWAGLDPVFGGNFPGGPLASAPLVQEVAGTLGDPSIRPRLWIDWGLVRTGGFHNEVIEAAATQRGLEMVDLLQATYGYTDGVDLGWEEDPIGEHDEISWARRFPAAMRALLGQ
ncbi:MAG TPA: alpha/beta hydrolase-fold protein, partial [Candidatus Nanopelagicales bacterium]|nr:alpha/beta hydrolase-fold protein [Candidatus Nanopelagicales bacterium]